MRGLLHQWGFADYVASLVGSFGRWILSSFWKIGFANLLCRSRYRWHLNNFTCDLFFKKLAVSKGCAFGRPSQRAKHSCGVLFLLAFSLAPLWSREKAADSFGKQYSDSKTPLLPSMNDS